MKDANSKYRNYTIIMALVWTSAFVLLIFNYHSNEYRNVENSAVQQAKQLFEKDLSYRSLVSNIGGVYVELKNGFLPNKYLINVPEREIESTTGRKFTLVNPSYFIKLVHESSKDLEPITHLTSSNPINPKNAPDEWEVKALKYLIKNKKAFFEIVPLNGEPHLRYMGMMMGTVSCTKCHSTSKVGEVRGGISVNIPLNSYYNKAQLRVEKDVLFSGIIWVLGLILLVQVNSKLNSQWRAQKDVERQLIEKEQRLNTFFSSSIDGYYMLTFPYEVPLGKILNNAELSEILKSGKIEKYNNSLVEIFNFNENIIGKNEVFLSRGLEDVAAKITTNVASKIVKLAKTEANNEVKREL